MSTANNLTNTPNPAIKRKKRLLSSVTRSIKTDPNEPNETTPKPPQKKRKRKLNIPTMDKPTLLERPNSSSPPPTPSQPQQPTTPMPTPTKRSLRAASEAIVKREKQRAKPPSPPPKPTLPCPEKAPVTRRKRKLNTQKVVIPKSSSQEFEVDGDDSYDQYLESNTSSTLRKHSLLNIPSNDAIVIGVPTKKRKLGRTATTATTATSTPPKRSIMKSPESSDSVPITTDNNDTLDLSQHSILPNQSYVAHLPQTQISRRRRSTTTSTVTSTSSVGDSNSSIISQMDMTLSDTVLTTMESYTTKSSPTIFYDAISDFEDMTIDDDPIEEMVELEQRLEQKQEQGHEQLQRASSFWGSILKPFKH